MELNSIIKNKTERLAFFKERLNTSEHVFFSIINNKFIFVDEKERVLGYMIFYLCQNSLEAIRIENTHLYEHYIKRINSIFHKIKYSKIDGINAILYPMIAYKYYRQKLYDNAISEMTIAIKSLINISDFLEENAWAPILEQYKNLSLVFLQKGDLKKSLDILDFVSNGFDNNHFISSYFFPINLKDNLLKKFLLNNIIDEILIKVYKIDESQFLFFLKKTLEIMLSSPIYTEEYIVLNKFLKNRIEKNDIYSLIELNLPAIIQGNMVKPFLKSIRLSDKYCIQEYFKQEHNLIL